MDANRLRSVANDLRWLVAGDTYLAHEDEVIGLAENMERESYITQARGAASVDASRLDGFVQEMRRIADERAQYDGDDYLVQKLRLIVDAMRDARKRAAA